MKIHQNFFRALAVGGLSLSMVTAQSTGTPGAVTSQDTGKTPGTQQSSSAGQNTDSRSGSSAAHTGTAGQPSGHVAGAAGSTQPGAEQMIGRTDREFMMNAAQGGMMEVQVAQMAQQKAASNEVKEFARKLEQDHSKANDKLKKIAEQRGVQLPTDIGKHQQHVAKLQNLSGEQFDRAFMKMQVQHHKKDVKEFRKYQERSMDTNVKEFAAAELPVLQGHYEQAQQLSANTGTRSRTADQTNATPEKSGAGKENQGQDSKSR